MMMLYESEYCPVPDLNRVERNQYPLHSMNSDRYGDQFPSGIIDNETITLRNGLHMPLLGLGTTHSGGYNHESVVFALKNCQYRMVDTAKRYGVEEKLGVAIQESQVRREELFLTSKLWPVDFGANVRQAFQLSRQRLATDYLDLYLIHFPEVPRWFQDARGVKEETWRQMERLYDDGVVKAIGVSNYNEADLEELLDFCSVKPHVNQFEFHPCYNPVALRHFCAEENVTFMGYCPLAKGTILDEPSIVRIAEKHRRTPAQICIRWSIENGVPAIPKSRKLCRIAENCLVFDFALNDEDMQMLSQLHDDRRKVIKLENLQEKFELPDGYKLNK